MSLYRVDLNLLLVFKALYTTHSVTLAAERFGITQPAMSNALARLRDLLEDPLFVHTSSGMQPTPFAEEIASAIDEGLIVLEKAIRHRSVFNPARSHEIFRFHMTDMGQISFLPKLLQRMEQVAPNTRVEVETLPLDEIRAGLISGRINFAVGHLTKLNERGIHSLKLLDGRYAVMLRTGHPAIGKRLTHKVFQDALHIVVASVGGGHHVVEQALLKSRVKIFARVPDIFAVPSILASTDLMATVPERVAQELARSGQFTVQPLPLTIPDFEVRLFWQSRFDADPAQTWMRKQITSLFPIL